MVVAHFLRWVDHAKVGERAAAAAALARIYIQGELSFEDRCAAEAALTFLLDDPSAKVRQSLADALSLSPFAPPQVISALASDQPEVAALVLGRSPLISDIDLIERVADGRLATQKLIADRAHVSMAVSAALAEVGEVEACAVLLANSRADIASLSFRRMAERFGDIPALREALIRDRRLPAESRHLLLTKLGEALRRAPLVEALMSEAHAERVTKNACLRASMTLIERTDSAEFPALIEHIRLRAELTTGLIVRAVAHGKIDFFGSALVALTGQDGNRVGSLLAKGYDTALSALFAKAGLDKQFHAAILCALKVWRQVALGKRVAGPQEVSRLMIEEIGGQAAHSELAVLLKAIHLEALRANARGHALAIAAA